MGPVQKVLSYWNAAWVGSEIASTRPRSPTVGFVVVPAAGGTGQFAPVGGLTAQLQAPAAPLGLPTAPIGVLRLANGIGAQTESGSLVAFELKLQGRRMMSRSSFSMPLQKLRTLKD